MSVSPAQNFSKPPPVPEVPTVTLTPEFSAWNSSAIASVSGATVLDPSMRIEPERSPPPPLAESSSLLPHAATPTTRTAAEAMTASHLELVTLSPSRLFTQIAGPGAESRDTRSGPPRACYLAVSRM